MKLQFVKAVLITMAMLVASPTTSLAKPPSVVATIKPVHSLAAALMSGIGEPYLLIRGAGSPHAYSLKPSDARRLSTARLIFWVGEGLETFLVKPLKALGGNATVIELSEIKGLHHLKTRKGGLLPDRDIHDDHAGHKHHTHDMHLWLDPRNAAVMARAMANALVKTDPAHKPDYERNRDRLLARIVQLERELGHTIKPVRRTPYVTFHDAYQYFEHRFKLRNAAIITVNPDRRPGVRRLTRIRTLLSKKKIRCVFREPQFPPKLVNVIVRGTGSKVAVLDPLGAELIPGQDAYFHLMKNLAKSLANCLRIGS